VTTNDVWQCDTSMKCFLKSDPEKERWTFGQKETEVNEYLDLIYKDEEEVDLIDECMAMPIMMEKEVLTLNSSMPMASESSRSGREVYGSAMKANLRKQKAKRRTKRGW